MTDNQSSIPDNAHWGTTPLRYLLISVYWLPVSLFWGMILTPILPTRVADFVTNPLHQGRYLASISIIGASASAIVQLLVGPISDHCRARWGRRRWFLLIGTLGGIGGMLSFAWSHSFLMLTFSYFIIQLFMNIANGPYQALIPDHVPADRQGIASAYMGIMRLLGEAGGPILAGIFLTKANADMHPGHARFVAVEQLMYIDAALFIFCLIPALLFVPDDPSPLTETWQEAMPKLFNWNLRVNASFFWLLLSRAVYNLGFYIAIFFLEYYVRDSLHVGAKYAGPLTTIMVCTIGGALLATYPAGWLADRTSKKLLVFISCGFSAVATFAFALSPTIPFAIASAVAFGIGWGVFCAVDWALACNVLPTNGGAAKWMAIWSLSITIPQVLAPGFGPTADLLNAQLGLGAGWRAAFAFGAFCVIGGALLMRKVVERPLHETPRLEPDSIIAGSPSSS